MRRPVLAFTIALAASVVASPLDQKDVEYARRSGKPLLLDLHIPDGPGPWPATILVHGGGFDQGTKSTNTRPLFEPLADAGFAWFSIDYRLAPEAHFPEAMSDVTSAILWVKSHAAEYRVASTKIALIGESAGGLLVNYAGTHETPESRVAAVVDFYGPSDYATLSQLRREHPERFDMNTINRHAANGGGIHFFGVERLDAEGVAKLHSLAPISAVHKGMPPFLCIHGTKDDQVDFAQTTEFCAAIRRVGSKCDVITVPGGAHGMSRWTGPEMKLWKADMIAWLKSTLGSS